jgi:hypothetical protein
MSVKQQSQELHKMETRKHTATRSAELSFFIINWLSMAIHASHILLLQHVE